MGTPMKDRHAVKLSDEELAELDAVREQFQAERPGPEQLVDRGEIDEPVPHGQFVELLSLVDQVKRAREQAGMSLTDLSQRSGLTRAAISRLENGWNNNPTLDTLYRYALAAGIHIKLTAEPVSRPEGGRKRSFSTDVFVPVGADTMGEEPKADGPKNAMAMGDDSSPIISGIRRSLHQQSRGGGPERESGRGGRPGRA